MTAKPLIIDGEVHYDAISKAIYSTDASMYQIMPDMVAVPQSEADVKAILAYAAASGRPVLPRGSGTSLAGQTVNSGIVIDMTKYFNKIVSIDAANQTAVVQPGVMRDQLNDALLVHGLHFSPDPATSNRASIGGMVANNSSGTKSILYGKTSENLVGLKVMLADGTVLHLNTKSASEYDAICAKTDREGEVYRAFRTIIFNNSEGIKNTYPKVLRRVTGYALDAFIDTENWNLAQLICGCEGTLALILEIELSLTPLPKYQNMVVIHYDDRFKGIQSVASIVEFGPAAVEVLDYNVISQSKLNPITKKYHDSIITGEPDIVLTVEFYGQTLEEIEDKAQHLVSYLTDYPSAYAYPIFYDKAKINDGLNLRKDGLGLLMGKVEPRKPQAFVEDSAIPLEHLAEYVEKVYAICDKLKVEMVIYAHASVGVLHIRPILDLTVQEDIDLMKTISNEVFHLVKSYGGSWSGEHGDGRNRGPRIREYYGDKIYGAFKEIKQLFDPNNILNPNIIIDVPPMDHNLRYGTSYKDQQYDFQFKYHKDHSFQDLVHACSGVGACRKNSGGTMCPSFRATQDEKDSTRGRANILRLAMSKQMGFESLLDDEVKEVLDLCLSCKACKSECPSNVDMAKLKSEVLQLRYDKKGASLVEQLPKYAPTLSKWISGWAAPLVNNVQASGIFRSIAHSLLGVHKERVLPAYASTSLVDWYNKMTKFKSDNKIAIFADTYINYHQPEIGKNAITLLNQLGYEVILTNPGCCQRPLISNGFLKDAAAKGKNTLDELSVLIKSGVPVVTFEPSCYTALTADLPDLLADKTVGETMIKGILPIEEFLANEIKKGNIDKKLSCTSNEIVIHGHCHQKATYGTQSIKTLLTAAEVSYKELETGCCGMAGAFGYEKNHYDMSVTIANQALIPQLKENPNAVVVAHGFSCKHQIHDLADRKVYHVVELLKVVND